MQHGDAVHARQVCRTQDCLRRAVRYHTTRVKEHQPGAEARRQGQVVEHYNHGLALARCLLQQLHDVQLVIGIERGNWVV